MNTITISISGPAKAGKTALAYTLAKFLDSMGRDIVLADKPEARRRSSEQYYNIISRLPARFIVKTRTVAQKRRK